jgi:hypothetical protein
MPRLRRQARQKRIRPQLAAGVWAWLQGKKTYEELPEDNKFDLLILTTGVRSEKKFWDRITAAVKAGEVEISEEKEHYSADPPLLPDLVR